MINSLIEEPRFCPFTNYPSKPAVLKRKADTEFAKREWEVRSDGFSVNSPTTFDKKTKKILLRHKTTNGPHSSSTSKSTSKKTKTELYTIDSTCPNIDSKSPENSNKFSVKENETASKNSIHFKQPGSVFLEVQNIKSLFQKNSSAIEPKPFIKLSSEFSKKLKAEILYDLPKSNKKAHKTLSIKSVAQVKAKNHRTEINGNNNKELKNVPNIVDNTKNNLRSQRIKAIYDFPNNDVALQHLNDQQNIPDSFRDDKTDKIFDSSRRLSNSPSKISKYEDNQIKNTLNGNDSPKLLLENAKFEFPKPSDRSFENGNLQNESYTCYKSLITELEKPSRINIFPKKTLPLQNAFENSFKKPVSVKNVSKFLCNSLQNEVPKTENVPKRVKVDKCTFNFPSPLPVPSATCAIKKINIADLTLPHATKESTIVEKTNDFSTRFEFPLANAGMPQITESSGFNESTSQGDSFRSEMSLVDFSKLLETKSDGGNKGSSWMQELKDTFVEEEIHQEEPVKKKIRNIIPGGLAEEMLKLQRRENSEKVIWSHKIHRNKRKAQNDSLCLILNSISTFEDFVIAKASLATPKEPQSLSDKEGNIEGQNSLQHNDTHCSHLTSKLDELKQVFKSDLVFILFKRKEFTKLQLKPKDAFNLYQPWQLIHVKSIPYPLILCAYFIDKVTSIDSVVNDKEKPHATGLKEPQLLLKQVHHPETATEKDLLFFKRDEPITFSARIQRIWKKEFRGRNPDGSYSSSTYLRYSVLLQIKEGTFHELRILPGSIPNQWYDLINEGKCYRFHNLGVTHRTSLKRDKNFRNLLETFHQENGSYLNQDFCYQLMFSSSSKCPEEIAEEGFPDYFPSRVQPLKDISKIPDYNRITCIAKVLLLHKDIFYISDESLVESTSTKYIQVQFLMATEIRPSITGSVVLVKEALVEEGSLVIDNYSQITILTENIQEYQENEIKVKNLADIYLNNVIPLLQMHSKVEDLVYAKGVVSSVNESTAYTWLHCSFCRQENLVQDANSVIYCEDCSRIVPCPVLKIKLEVVICCPQLPLAVINIQLLSSTIKKILQIPGSTYQPQCSVCDVLNKEIGPLCCYILSCDTSEDKTVFNLLEVDSS